jgi:hypothetical protein
MQIVADEVGKEHIVVVVFFRAKKENFLVRDPFKKIAWVHKE